MLGSAYLLGASREHLTQVYEEEAKQLEPWRNSPGEVSKHDWRAYLGRREYQRAFIDFFEDELVVCGYDWKKLLAQYLFEGDEPLINCVVAGREWLLLPCGADRPSRPPADPPGVCL